MENTHHIYVKGNLDQKDVVKPVKNDYNEKTYEEKLILDPVK